MLTHDHGGKPSAMRAASLITVITGCAAFLLCVIGPGDGALADECLWMVGVGLGGKAGQRLIEEMSARTAPQARQLKD